MEKYLHERYGRRNRADLADDDDFDQLPEEIAQQSLLPDVNSPNLWPVKCRMGEEKQTALLLMRKYLALEKNEKVRLSLPSRFPFFTRTLISGVANQIGDRQRRRSRLHLHRSVQVESHQSGGRRHSRPKRSNAANGSDQRNDGHSSRGENSLRHSERFLGESQTRRLSR